MAMDIEKNVQRTSEQIASFAKTQNPRLSANDIKTISEMASEYIKQGLSGASGAAPFGALAATFRSSSEPYGPGQTNSFVAVFDRKGNLSDIKPVNDTREQQLQAQVIAKGLGIKADTPDALVAPDKDKPTGYTAAMAVGNIPTAKICP